MTGLKVGAAAVAVAGVMFVRPAQAGETVNYAPAPSWVEAGGNANAAADYGAALKLDDSRSDLRGRRAQALLFSGDTKTALAEFDQLVKLQPSSEAFAWRAQAKMQQRDYAGSEADYRKAIELDPDNPNLATQLVNLVRVSGDEKRANAMMEETLAARPTSPQLLLDRAERYLKSESYDKALADLKSAQALPMDQMIKARVNFTLSQVYEGQKRYPEALQAMDAAVEAFPQMGIMLNNRCWLKATRGLQAESALADCNEALRLAPGESSVLDSRGLAYLRLHRFKEALADYNAALAGNDGGSTSLMGRSLAKAGLGDAAGAKADRDKAVRSSPKIVEQFADWGLIAKP